MTTNNISVRGIFGYNHDVFRTAINLLEQKKIQIETLITSRIKLNQVPDMFKVLGNSPHDHLKVIIELD